MIDRDVFPTTLLLLTHSRAGNVCPYPTSSFARSGPPPKLLIFFYLYYELCYMNSRWIDVIIFVSRPQLAQQQQQQVGFLP